MDSNSLDIRTGWDLVLWEFLFFSFQRLLDFVNCYNYSVIVVHVDSLAQRSQVINAFWKTLTRSSLSPVVGFKRGLDLPRCDRSRLVNYQSRQFSYVFIYSHSFNSVS